MTKSFIKKNTKLSLEFDKYLFEHPKLFDHIPNGAYLIITVKDDHEFNSNSRSMVKGLKNKKVVEAHKSAKRWNLRPFDLQSI